MLHLGDRNTFSHLIIILVYQKKNPNNHQISASKRFSYATYMHALYEKSKTRYFILSCVDFLKQGITKHYTSRWFPAQYLRFLHEIRFLLVCCSLLPIITIINKRIVIMYIPHSSERDIFVFLRYSTFGTLWLGIQQKSETFKISHILTFDTKKIKPPVSHVVFCITKTIDILHENFPRLKVWLICQSIQKRDMVKEPIFLISWLSMVENLALKQISELEMAKELGHSATSRF